MTPSPKTFLERLRTWAPPVVLFAVLLGVGTLATRSTYSPPDLLRLTVLYGALAAALSGLARRLASRGTGAAIAGALGVGLVVAWHLQEQLRPPSVGSTLSTPAGLAWFVGLALLAATAQFLAVRRAPPPAPGSGRRPLMAALVLLVVLVTGYRSTGTFRWHLLRHNKLVGTPAVHLLSPTVGELEDEDYARRVGSTEDGAPPVVLRTGVALGGGPFPGGRGEAASASPEASDRARDVVFVLLDTLRADALAQWGGDPGLMPALNAFGEGAIVLGDLSANSSWTRPSVASFFTGLAPEEHGAAGWAWAIAPEVETMAQVFGRRGYETAAFVANHSAVDGAGGFDRGFDLFEPLVAVDGPYVRAEEVTDRVVAWLADRSSRGASAPLFLYVHYLDPHTPYLSSGPVPATVVSHGAAKRLYDDELRYLDRALGRLLASLEDSPRRPRVTLVTSDHGEEFGEHDARGHGQTLYSEVLAIPAILSIDDPLVPRERGVVPGPLEGRDLFGILLRAAAGSHLPIRQLAERAARPSRAATVSFAKAAEGAAWRYLLRPYRQRIYARMLERDGWRLVWSAYGDTHELYDLRRDPGERRNLAARRPDLVMALRAEMDAHPPVWRRTAAARGADRSLDRLRALGYVD